MNKAIPVIIVLCVLVAFFGGIGALSSLGSTSILALQTTVEAFTTNPSGDPLTIKDVFKTMGNDLLSKATFGIVGGWVHYLDDGRITKDETTTTLAKVLYIAQEIADKVNGNYTMGGGEGHRGGR